jgi:hypothetical protein
MAAESVMDEKERMMHDFKQYEKNFLSNSNTSFISNTLKFKKIMTQYETSDQFICKIRSIINEYEIFIDFLVVGTIRYESMHDMIDNVVPLIKFTYGFEEVFQKHMSEHFLENNSYLQEGLKSLQRQIEAHPLTLMFKNIYDERFNIFDRFKSFDEYYNEKKKEYFKNSRKMKDDYYMTARKYIPKNERVLRGDKHEIRANLLHSLQKMNEFQQEMEERQYDFFNYLRSIIQIDCPNCVKRKPNTILGQRYYLIEHSNERNDISLYNCKDCCVKHKISKNVVNDKKGKKTIIAMEDKFYTTDKKINNYRMFVRAFLEEEDVFKQSFIRSNNTLSYSDHQTVAYVEHMNYHQTDDFTTFD